MGLVPGGAKVADADVTQQIQPQTTDSHQEKLHFLSQSHSHTNVGGSTLPDWPKLFQGVDEVGLHHGFTQTPDVDHWAGGDVMGVFSIVLKHSRVQQ